MNQNLGGDALLIQQCARILQKKKTRQNPIIPNTKMRSSPVDSQWEESRWKEVLQSMSPGVSMEPGFHEMRSILSLSYDDLPCPIRKCLLYLSIFPEDHVISRKRLVNRWIAEGLVDEESKKYKKTKSAVGEGYFYELVNRSLIEPVKIRYDGHVKACRVQNTIRDFIVSVSTVEQNFVTLVGAPGETTDYKVRHLSMQISEEIDIAFMRQQDLSHVRSVTVFGPITKIPSDLKFPMLRVLDLEDCYESYHGNVDKGHSTADVRGLYQAAYLQLGPIGPTRLPKEIGHLQRLQTLDLRETGLEEVPESITQLTRLVRLLLDDIELPVGISKMTALEELKTVDVNRQSKELLKELAQLYKLKILKLSFYFYIGDELDEMFKKQDVLLSSLSKLKDLHSLSITVYVIKVPAWMQNLDRLQKLRLHVYCMNEQDLKILGSLRSLQDLFLDLTDIPEPMLSLPSEKIKEKLVFRSTRKDNKVFQSLKYFGIQNTIQGMTMLEFEPNFMPKVEYLKLELNAYDSNMPQTGVLDFGIQQLMSSLKVVDVKIWCRRRDDEVVKAALDAIKLMPAKVHDKLPIVKSTIYTL